jgi:hypothetical protein
MIDLHADDSAINNYVTIWSIFLLYAWTDTRRADSLEQNGMTRLELKPRISVATKR